MRLLEHRPSRGALWAWLLATVATGGAVFAQGAPLKSVAETPGGIVDFELAGTPQRAAEVLDAWQTAGLGRAATVNLWIDFLFLVSYSTFLALALIAVARAFRQREWRPVAAAITLLAVGQWLAGALDAVENVSLLALAGKADLAALPGLAAAVAATKFALVGTGIIVLVGSGIVLFTTRRSA